MIQKSKTGRLIALFVAIAMMASLLPAMLVSASTLQMGAPDTDDGRPWRQMRWNIGSEEDNDGNLVEHRISMEDFAAATQIVLEFSSQPETDIYMVIFGDGNAWNFGTGQHPIFTPDEEYYITTVTYNLADHPTYAAIIEAGNAGLILASGCLPDTFVRASLVLGAGGTVLPQPTPAPTPVPTPVPHITTPVPVAAGINTLELTVDNQTYRLNGIPGTLDVAPTIISDRTMVPFRFIGQALGATVDWNDATRTASFTLDGVTQSVSVGQPLYIGGNYYGTPQIVNDRTLVPVRVVSEMMGADVQWNGLTRTVTITFGEEAPPALPPELPPPVLPQDLL